MYELCTKYHPFINNDNIDNISDIEYNNKLINNNYDIELLNI